MIVLRSVTDTGEERVDTCPIAAFAGVGAVNVTKVTLMKTALLVAFTEFNGIPMPKYITEYDAISWYGDDAKFIVANLKDAYNAYLQHLQNITSF